MIINFEKIEETRIPQFKGGTGDTISKMRVDELGKIMYGKLEPGSSIGFHPHETNCQRQTKYAHRLFGLGDFLSCVRICP